MFGQLLSSLHGHREHCWRRYLYSDPSISLTFAKQSHFSHSSATVSARMAPTFMFEYTKNHTHFLLNVYKLSEPYSPKPSPNTSLASHTIINAFSGSAWDTAALICPILEGRAAHMSTRFSCPV